MRGLKFGLLIVAVLVAGLSAGCGGKVPPSTVGKIATYGDQAMHIGDAALSGVDLLISQGVLPQAQGVQVIRVIREMGVEGVRLAAVLKEVQAAKTSLDKSTAVEKVRTILKAIQGLIQKAVIPVADAGTRQKIVDLLQAASDLLLDVSFALPAPAK